MADLRYAVKRRGPTCGYSEKRIRNDARRKACLMAYDAFLEKFNAEDPTDPALVAECQRVLEELRRRGRAETEED